MKEMKIYEIQKGFFDTLDILLESDGNQEDIDTYNEVMTFLKEELQKKSSSILTYIQELQAKSKIAKEEADRLLKLSKSRANKAEKLKKYLTNVLQSLDVNKIETNLGSYILRKSYSVDVYDMSVLPEEFVRVTEERKADKEKIREYIKANGEIIKGARIIENYSLNIK